MRVKGIVRVWDLWSDARSPIRREDSEWNPAVGVAGFDDETKSTFLHSNLT